MIVPKPSGSGRSSSPGPIFRDAIPNDLYEAARVDGASDLRFLLVDRLPLAKPMIAVIALMYAILQWNTYFDALIYLRTDGLYPLQIVLRNILILNSTRSNRATPRPRWNDSNSPTS